MASSAQSTEPSEVRSRIAGRASRAASAPLRSTVIVSSSSARHASYGGVQGRGVDRREVDPPRGARHGLLEGVGAGRDGDGDLRLHAVRQGVRDDPRELGGVDVIGQVDVEVLAEALVAGGQGEPEAQAGPRGEPLAVGDANARAPQGPLPDPRDVAVRQEAHLAELAEPQTLLHVPTPTGFRDRLTGTSPPRMRP